MTSYFDDGEFHINPNKSEIITDYYNMDVEQSYVQKVYYRKHYIGTKDNWFSSLLNSKEYTFLEKTVGSNYVGMIVPNMYEMFTLFINKHNEEVFIEREVYTLLQLLSATGGFAEIVSIFLSYYAKGF